jgi:hypothetical protein
LRSYSRGVYARQQNIAWGTEADDLWTGQSCDSGKTVKSPSSRYSMLRNRTGWRLVAGCSSTGKLRYHIWK